MFKIACYEAIFRPQGEDTYDVPFQPECPPESGIEYVIFANVRAESEHAGWQIRPAAFDAKHCRRRSKLHKLQPHLLFPDADFTLWLDGIFTPITSPRALVEEYASDPDVHLVSHRHPVRSCLYAGAEYLIRRGKATPRESRSQIERYRREDYPAGNGLAEAGALLRRNSPEAVAFNGLWLAEVLRGSKRDQVSLDYSRWKVGLPSCYFRGSTKNSPHFRRRPHRFARDHPEFRWEPGA